MVYKIATPPLAPLNVEGLGNPLPLSGTGQSDEDHHLQLRSHHLEHDPDGHGRQWEPLLHGSRGDPPPVHGEVQGRPHCVWGGRPHWRPHHPRHAAPPRQRQGLRPGAHA